MVAALQPLPAPSLVILTPPAGTGTPARRAAPRRPAVARHDLATRTSRSRHLTCHDRRRAAKLGSVPTLSRPRRRGVITRTACALALLAVAACDPVGDPEQASGTSEFVAELASRLAGAATSTYTATYTIGGGVTGTIAQAQAPARVAYTYPTGITVTTPEGTTQCVRGTEMTCTRGVTPAQTAVGIQSGGLIRPETVISMLNTTALDADAIISESDTTFAGVPATCAQVTNPNGPDGYDACVTSTGLLASFNGTVGGAHVVMALNRLNQTVADDAFTLPAGARIVKSPGS